MASLTRWTWVWVDSGSWWWTGRPGMLQFMGSQRVGHDWATELNWTIFRVYPNKVTHIRFSKVGYLLNTFPLESWNSSSKSLSFNNSILFFIFPQPQRWWVLPSYFLYYTPLAPLVCSVLIPISRIWLTIDNCSFGLGWTITNTVSINTKSHLTLFHNLLKKHWIK